jgi:hypothetical protein
MTEPVFRIVRSPAGRYFIQQWLMGGGASSFDQWRQVASPTGYETLPDAENELLTTRSGRGPDVVGLYDYRGGKI